MAWSIRGAAGAALLAVAVFGAHGDAQQPPADRPADAQSADQAGGQPPDASNQGDQQPVFRSAINFVRVDVIVSGRDGAPLANLTKDDFQVFEDGEPQEISTFKFVTLDGGATPGPDGPPRPIRNDFDEEAEAARDDVRVFAIFLDDYHVRLGSSLQIRDPLSKFVENQLGPSDMVALMYPLQPLGALRFTRNHEAVVQGIQQFVGRKFNYEPMNDFEQRYVSYPTEVVERIRAGVSLSALEALIVHLGALKEGRKALLLVSEGYTYMVPPQMRSDNALVPPLGGSSSDPLLGLDDPTEYRAAFLAGSQMQDDLRQVFDAANRNNVSIYAVDPRGLATSEFDIADNVGARLGRDYLRVTQDTLRTLSDETDGRAIINRNDVGPGLEQVVADSSAYYLLGYDSAAAPTDGKFHKIEVRVNQRNVQVRARKGYWAITHENAERILAPKKPGPPPGVTEALAVVNQPVRARVVQSWLGTSRGADGKTTVTYLWEPTPRPGAAGRGEEAPARVSIMALGDDGSPYFRGTAARPSAGGRPGASQPGRVSFDVPPGLMHMRLTVESENDGVLDREVRDVEVPDLTAPDAAFGTPEVFRARTARALETLKADPDPVPEIGRSFSRAERLLIRVPVYGASPTLAARLLNQSGDSLEDLTVEVPTSPDGPAQIELALASLAPGDYVVEITATAGGEPTTAYVGVKVGS